MAVVRKRNTIHSSKMSPGVARPELFNPRAQRLSRCAILDIDPECQSAYSHFWPIPHVTYSTSYGCTSGMSLGGICTRPLSVRMLSV